MRGQLAIIPVASRAVWLQTHMGDGLDAIMPLDHRGGFLKQPRKLLLFKILVVVVGLILIHERVELHERRRHHELVRRHRRGERLAVRDEREHRARHALGRVLHEQRRDRVVVPEIVVRDQHREVGLRDLRLLEGELEEAEHLVRVLGRLHPRVDERDERGPRVARLRDLIDLVLGRRQAREDVFDLRDVDARRIGLERLHDAGVAIGRRRRGVTFVTKEARARERDRQEELEVSPHTLTSCNG